jgi:HlyD family secretion protein
VPARTLASAAQVLRARPVEDAGSGEAHGVHSNLTMQRAEHHHLVRNVVVVTVIAAAVAGAWWGLRIRAARSAQSVHYEVATIQRGHIQAKVTATGTVNPIKTVQVGTQVSGTIQGLGANFNSVVEPGQMIAQIDPRLFQASVNQARANLLVAHANTRKARISARDARRIAGRNHELANQQLIAQQTADTSEANAQVAEAAVDAAAALETQAQAALETSKLNLAFTKIVSPINGTVISRNVDVGQTVAASFASPTLFLIGEDLTKMQVDTNIAEADIGRLSRGLAASFTVDAYPTETFHAVVREIRISPQVIQNVVTYDAVLEVANPGSRLAPGMTANVELVYADRSDVMRVPNAALRFHPKPELVRGAIPSPALGHKLVWIERDGKLAPVDIVAGVSDGTWTELVEGKLGPDDHLVIETTGTTAPKRTM